MVKSLIINVFFRSKQNKNKRTLLNKLFLKVDDAKTRTLPAGSPPTGVSGAPLPATTARLGSLVEEEAWRWGKRNGPALLDRCLGGYAINPVL
jgi:hypothetical protein